MENIPPLSGNKRRTRSSPEERGRDDVMRSRLDGWDGDEIIFDNAAPPVVDGVEMGVIPVPAAPPAAPSVNQLNQYIQQIIEGQVDVTVPPATAASTARQTAADLMRQLNEIIAQKEQQAEERQAAIAETRRVEMEEVERAQIIDENMRMMTAINAALAESNARLGRTDRLALNARIQQLINDTIIAAEIDEQMEAEARPLRENIRGLYNGLIQYYTEMASYGYQRAPEVLANIGSMLGGTAMLGAAVVGGGTGGAGGTLMTLANYLGTATITASGLYLLQRGGLPVQDFLQGTGAAARQCIQRRCQQIAEYGIQGLTSLINEANERLHTVLEQDSDSAMSSQSSASSGYSTVSNYSSASSASQAIRRILGPPSVEQQEREVNEVLGVVPPEEPLTQDPYDFADIDGGRKRKSRRHTKSRKTRKGRKGRKHRMTKKGRKHHKTMKRYRSKMRR